MIQPNHPNYPMIVKASEMIVSAKILIEQKGSCQIPKSLECCDCPLQNVDCLIDVTSPMKTIRSLRLKLAKQFLGK